ncbi:MAG: ankyrin repeat domain-containing protein [Parachlamydia sp.]|nr:ankyrin repeat domain-containing protein [Parachlamydia sp.]
MLPITPITVLNIADDYQPTLEEKKPSQSTPLYLAVLNDDATAVSSLIDGGTSLVERYEPDERTILHVAILNNKFHAAIELIHKGADPNAKTTNGYTPLYLAWRGGCDQLNELLIKCGARIDEPNGPDNHTVRYLCITQQGGNLAKKLLFNAKKPFLTCNEEFPSLNKTVKTYLRKVHKVPSEVQDIKEVQKIALNIKEAVNQDLLQFHNSLTAESKTGHASISHLWLLGKLNRKLWQLGNKVEAKFPPHLIMEENTLLDAIFKIVSINECSCKSYFPNYFLPPLNPDICTLILPHEIKALARVCRVNKMFRTAVYTRLKALLALPSECTVKEINEEIKGLLGEVSAIEKRLPDSWIRGSSTPFDAILSKMTTITTEDLVLFFTDIKSNSSTDHLVRFMKRTLPSHRRSANVDSQVEEKRKALAKKYLSNCDDRRRSLWMAESSLVPFELLLQHGESNAQFLTDLPGDLGKDTSLKILSLLFKNCNKTEDKKLVIQWAVKHKLNQFLEYLRLETKLHDDIYALAEATYSLGSHFFETPDITDQEIAFTLYEEAAIMGHPLAKFRLARCFSAGNGTEINVQEAFKWYRSAALDGHSEARYQLAICYRDGRGTENNEKEFIAWLQKAAQQNHAEAQTRLAICYFNGEGVNQDFVAAYTLFEKAKELGHGGAYHYLVYFYREGPNTCQEEKIKLDAYLRRLKENEHHSQVLYQIGMQFKNGQGTFPDANKAVEYWKKAAQLNYAEAQFELGLHHYETSRSPAKWPMAWQNRSDAVDFFQKACAHHHVRAHYFLAQLYLGEEQVEYAILHFQQVVQSKDPIERIYLGIAFYHIAAYQREKGDVIQAAKTFLRAAELNNSDAQYSYGMCLYNGEGVRQNFFEAFDFLTSAAKNGHLSALVFLDYFYTEGRDTPQNGKLSFDSYQARANQDDPQAQYDLAMCYINGKGTFADQEKAVNFLQKAALKGHQGAQDELGFEYYNSKSVENDEARVFQDFAQTENRDAATYHRAICLLEGRGVEMEQEKAIQLLRDLSAKKHIRSQYALAICYLNGRGLTQDVERALKCLEELAIQKDCKEAQCRLGICYFRGKWVEQDFKKACEWFEKAAKHNHTDAEYRLGFCYLKGSGVEKDLIKAFEYFKRAAEKGHKKAQYEMGVFYLGKTFYKSFNLIEATYWLRKAANQRHKKAHEILLNQFKMPFSFFS